MNAPSSQIFCGPRTVFLSAYLAPTLKENPQEALIKSHRLMLRAGLIRKLASGTYSYLPQGFRALKKAEAIVRRRMNETGAMEVLLPAIHPADLWQETGRYEIMGEDMLHFRDRHGKMNVLGPTHEEIITDLARREIHSYKQLPASFYQIQTKFRDEMRPRSGVIRSREFIMKDAYSFHASDESLEETYQKMLEAYRKIFGDCGLEFFIVQADPGAMGGSGSQEFILFSDAGEDWMVQYGHTDQVVSVEMAKRQLRGLSLGDLSSAVGGKIAKVHTPGHSSVDGVASFLKKKPSDLVKTMIYEVAAKDGGQPQVFAVLVRGDHEVSEFKVKDKCSGAIMATRDTIEKLGSAFGFSGPFGLDGIPFYIDEDVLLMKDFVVGANQDQYHCVGVDLADIIKDDPKRSIHVGDFRQVIEGDKDPAGGPLFFKTAIELGHIFKLNLRYSAPMKAQYLDAQGKEHSMKMGCYGIGVNRILAAAIEQCADDKGIVWPKNISPFQVHVVLLDPEDTASKEVVNALISSKALEERGIDIMIDDRKESAGVKFNDADLMGFPVRVVIGSRNLKNQQVELKVRKSGQQLLVGLTNVDEEIIKQLDKLA